MSHPSDPFGVAIRQKKIQVDKKKKHAQMFVNICFLTREFSVNRTLLAEIIYRRRETSVSMLGVEKIDLLESMSKEMYQEELA
jgi:hypothetical protein